MRKYIYGVFLLMVLFACWIFFVNPSRVGNDRIFSKIAITFRLPEGYAFTEGAPFKLFWQSENSSGKLSVPVGDKRFNPFETPYDLVLTPSVGSRALVLNAKLYYCQKASRMCFQGDFQTRVPLGHQTVPVIPWVWVIEPKENTGLGTRR